MRDRPNDELTGDNCYTFPRNVHKVSNFRICGSKFICKGVQFKCSLDEQAPEKLKTRVIFLDATNAGGCCMCVCELLVWLSGRGKQTTLSEQYYCSCQENQWLVCPFPPPRPPQTIKNWPGNEQKCGKSVVNFIAFAKPMNPTIGLPLIN